MKKELLLLCLIAAALIAGCTEGSSINDPVGCSEHSYAECVPQDECSADGDLAGYTCRGSSKVCCHVGAQ